MVDVRLRCACGKLGGTALGVTPSAVCRVICYCHDCQAFARFLGRNDILDEWGGSDIVQLPPSKLRITGEMSALQCVRLSEKGMHRWYCGACKTPIGNTLGARVPFVGLLHSFCDHAADPRTRSEVLGEPLGHIQAQSAKKPLPLERRTSAVRATARAVRLMAAWWVTGAGSPSPFFTPGTRTPRAVPRVLSPEERRSL